MGRTKEYENKDRNDDSYFGKGIGAGLLESAIRWASENNYKSIISDSGIDSFPEYNNWSGKLPLKVFTKQGFQILETISATDIIPGHLKLGNVKLNENNTYFTTVIKKINRESINPKNTIIEAKF